MSTSGFKEKFKGITRTQKLLITALTLTGGLLFYLIGIATNIFAQPMFSTVYLAIGAAVTIGILGLAMFLRKRRTFSSKIQTRPAVPIVQRPVKAVSSDFKMAAKPDRTNIDQKIKPSSSPQRVEGLKAEPVKEPTVHQITVKPEVAQTTSTERFRCQSCKKEFGTPMLMIDYASPKAGLVSYCPYCYEPVDQQKKL